VATTAVSASGSVTTATAGPSESLPPLPPQPAAVAFPTVRWPRGPLPPGVAKSSIDAAVKQAFGGPDDPARVRSLLVVKGGKLVYEAYHPLDGPDSVMPSWSIAKSITSAVIGLLVGDGKLDVNAPAPVKAWADPSDPRHAITIADLLHMSSGLTWVEDYTNSPRSDIYKMIGAPNASEYVANQPLASRPGTVWYYSTGTAAILAGVIIDTLGSPQAAEHYIRTRLLLPIGITSTRFAHDGSGRWFGGFGADSTPRDFARFGLLYLRGGVWNHKRILPAGWVDFTRTPGPASPQYGAQWWLNYEPGTFTAAGLFGQYIVVAPALDLVIVVTSSSVERSSRLRHAVYTAFANA
jgi:CubicO group peptidase (beta-lactamase class C family)